LDQILETKTSVLRDRAGVFRADERYSATLSGIGCQSGPGVTLKHPRDRWRATQAPGAVAYRSR